MPADGSLASATARDTAPLPFPVSPGQLRRFSARRKRRRLARSKLALNERHREAAKKQRGLFPEQRRKHEPEDGHGLPRLASGPLFSSSPLPPLRVSSHFCGLWMVRVVTNVVSITFWRDWRCLQWVSNSWGPASSSSTRDAKVWRLWRTWGPNRKRRDLGRGSKN